MKYISVLFLFLFSFNVSAQFAPEQNPLRGIYIDKFIKTFVNNNSIDPEFSILGVDKNHDGIFEKEDAILKYAAENHITYIAMFDLHRILGRNYTSWDENLNADVNLEAHLDRFLRKAKSKYGITQLGAIGGSENFFDSLGSYLNRYPNSDIDVVNIEYEFWGSCSAEWPNYISILDAMFNFKQAYNIAHPSNPIITEAYLADLYACNSSYGATSVARTIDGCKSCSPCATCTNPQPRKCDRILHAWYASDPGTFNISEQDVFEDPLTEDSTDFHPIIYAESNNTGGTVDWTGVWFPLSPFNNIFTAEESYYTHWINTPGVALGLPEQNNVVPGGAHWFATTNMVGHLENPQIVQNTGPYCTNDSLQKITFNYYGPLEHNIAFQFWVTDDNNATVYPVAGGRIAGLSNVYQPQTSSATMMRSIDFSDSLTFPPCLLPHGNFTAHLLLKYENGTGQSYECRNSVKVKNSPAVSVSGREIFCGGDYTFLNADASGTTYTWYRNGKLMNETGRFLKVSDDGDYYYTMTGGNCAGTSDTIHIHVLANPSIAVNAVCNGNGTASLTTNLLPWALPVTTGAGGVLYRWNTGETTDQITVYPPSTNTTYRVVVINPFTGCTRTSQIVLKSPLASPYPSNIIVNQQPSPCSSNGTITANLHANSAPNNYLWSTGETTQTITNLPYGKYKVAMNVWASGCTTYDSVTIGTPPSNVPQFTANAIRPTCPGGSNGSIDLFTTGGDPPFTFYWPDIPHDSVHSYTSQNIDSLYAGYYKVIYTDANGCVFNQTVDLTGFATAFNVSSVSSNPVTGCATSANGTATVNITGSGQPFSFLWDDPLSQTTQTATGLTAGSHKVTITDNNGCSIETFVTVPSDNLPIHVELIDSSQTTTGCFNSVDGSLYLKITGGNEPYIVNSPWTADSNFAMLENIASGFYSIQITDDDGCIYVDSFEIKNKEELFIYANPNYTTCTGCTDGSINISISGGTAPFQYSFQPSSGAITSNTILNLAANIYTVCVTDNNGCTACTQSTVIDNPTGVYEIPSTWIFIMPNPFSDKTIITIQNNFTPREMIIYNPSGMIVMKRKLNALKSELDATDFIPGIYFLKITGADNISVVRKIVVTH